MKRTFLLTLLLTASMGLAQPEKAVFEVTLDRTSVALGDRVTATYTARLTAGARLEVESLVSPKLSTDEDRAKTFDFEVVPPPEIGKEEGGSFLVSQKIHFVPFVAGRIPVIGPHLAIVSPLGKRTPVQPATVYLTVGSRLPADQDREKLAPKGNRPPEIPKRSPWFWVFIALCAAALAAAIWFFVTRKKPQKVEAQVPQLSAEEEFLKALSDLGNRIPQPGADPRGFYSELTHLVKRYLERRIDKPVLEWTTLETIRRLRESGLEFPQEIGLSELLGSADRIKFGRAPATSEEAGGHLERARAVHRFLEQKLAPPAQPSQPGSEARPS